MDDLSAEEIDFYIYSVIPNLHSIEVSHDFVIARFDFGERGESSEVIFDYRAEV